MAELMFLGKSATANVEISVAGASSAADDAALTESGPTLTDTNEEEVQITASLLQERRGGRRIWACKVPGCKKFLVRKAELFFFGQV